MENPFSKVECITFSSCILDNRITNFNKWFPRVQTLEFYDNRGECIEHNFPNLEKLVISSTKCQIANISRALTLNPQLKYFHSYNQLDANFLQEFSENLQNIQDLCIDFSSKPIDTSIIHLKNVQRLSITCFQPMLKLPFAFGSVQKCHLKVIDSPDWNDVIRFINRHPTLTEFSITSSAEGADKTELFQALSKIETVEFRIHQFSIDDVIACTKAEKCLDKEWSLSIEGGQYVKLTR
ncbi:uncharacterized protein LOC116347321 [Contarinia nasturtii]|uniref:uncharacterized protein LOC116347321 n=1 Tax=Contarinia nasturtii TaxID=265458 RepID=UPI0012D38224|nr:uncharacterized protein LOC116347321 [Contarinia nasturtii]